MDSWDKLEAAYQEKVAAESKRRGLYIFLAIVLVNVGYWVWLKWPATTFEKCTIEMAEKAQGNSTIYTSLVHANCKSLPRARKPWEQYQETQK